MKEQNNNASEQAMTRQEMNERIIYLMEKLGIIPPEQSSDEERAANVEAENADPVISARKAAIIDDILEKFRALGLVIDEPEENGSERGGATV